MHANTKAVVSCLLGLVVAGCATSSTKLNQVHLGMAKSDLVSQLGVPDSAKVQANTEYLIYYLSNDKGARQEPYMVRLVDAKVESFGRYVQLFDTQSRSSGASVALGLGAIMPYGMEMDTVTQLQQLKSLQDQGVLTSEEVQRAKDRLLSKPD